MRVQYEIAQLFYEKYGKSTEKLTNSNLLNEVFFREIHQFYPYYQNQKYRYKEAKAKEIQQLDELRDQFLKEFESLILNVDQSVEVIDIELLIEKYTSLIPEYIKRIVIFLIHYFCKKQLMKILCLIMYMMDKKNSYHDLKIFHAAL